MEPRFNSERMIRYLLGELSTDEQVEMETEYFSDPEKFNLLQTIENDLIEGYVNGKLSNPVRAKFEAHYLTIASKREQVNFFKSLTKVIPLETNQPELATASPQIAGSGSSWWQSLSAFVSGLKLTHGLSYAAAILVIIGGVAWQVTESMRIREQLAQAERDRSALEKRAQELDQLIAEQRSANEKLTQERDNIQLKLEELSSPVSTTSPTVASLTFTLSGVRSVRLAEINPRKLQIKPNTSTVRLNFNLPVYGYSRYGVSLQNLAGQEIWKRSDLKSITRKAGEVLVITVPANQFRKGMYLVIVSGNNARGERVEIGQFSVDVEIGS